MNTDLTLMSQPWFLPAVAAVVFAAGLTIRPVWRSRSSGSKDSRRMYTSDERAIGFARTGGQCEYDRWMLWRCTRTAQHGDHFYPWSKGGATSMMNFVAACARCNTSKGAKVPTVFQRARIMARRRNYFPAHIPTEAGEWFSGVSRT